ncbi:hypothetical protein [Pectobacterium odoriferum]|uniref:hypothetical protein n=1 Tax=Pectobacterium odoriferum TaxID=78398 RepID=UPI000CD1E1FA|nr:hypothetical protein [Pectobacterium odoriferum]POD92316.1 hypothetical protein BVY06_19555 [Pectobacterium odoriferum]POE39918.1 hypothetical protein BV920_11050 [Pectobacterium odoriferum]
MSTTLKRYFATHIVQSDIDGLYEMRSHVQPAGEDGKQILGSELEMTEAWLASREELERLHDLLCQVLGKPRGLRKL